MMIVVGSLEVLAIPKKEKAPSGSSATPEDTVLLNDGYRAKKDNIGNLVAKPECSGTTTTGCWTVTENQLIYKSDTEEIKGDDLDNPDKVSGFWKGGVTVDEYGNLVAGDTIYSGNGLAEIKTNSLGGREISGKVTAFGGSTVVPVTTKEGAERMLIHKGDIVVELDKETYTLLSSAASGVELTVEANKISWTVGQQQNSISQKTEAGVTTTTIKLGDDKKTTWTFADRTYKSEDGWEKSGDKFINKELNSEVGFSQVGDTRTITEKNIKTNEQTITTFFEKGDKQIKEVEQTERDKKTNQDKVVSFQRYDAQGRRIGERVKDGEGKLNDFNFYNPDGTLAGVCYEGAGCKEGASSNEKNIWVTRDEFCVGEADVCFTPAGEHRRGSWKPEDDCKKVNPLACDGINAREAQYYLGEGLISVLFSETEFQLEVLGPILSLRPGWQALSSWWFRDTRIQDLQSWARETFDQMMVAEYLVPREVCDYDEQNKVKRDGESATFIEVAPGVVQFVGSITAEKTPQPGPLFCSEEVPCAKGECEEDGICRENGEELQGTFYKITWAVQAPQDESFTPYIDENGIAIAFNVRIFGESERWLYPAEGGGSDTTLQLENGASDRDTIVTYSPYDYNKICILFGRPSKDLSGDEVKEICAEPIVESTLGRVEWEQSGRPGSEGSSSGTVKVDEVGRAQI